MKRLEWLPPTLVLVLVCSLSAAGFWLRVGDAVAQEPGMPKHIAAYLKATAEEAAIPLWSNDGKPQADSLIYGSFGDSVSQGELGFPESMTVREVIDDSTARIDLHWKHPAKYKVDGPNGGEFYKLERATKRNVMLHGMRTDGLVDGESYRVGKVLRVTGTAMHGTATLWLFEPVDMTPHVDAFKAAAKKRAG
jgi:hypothetical protein